MTAKHSFHIFTFRREEPQRIRAEMLSRAKYPEGSIEFTPFFIENQQKTFSAIWYRERPSRKKEHPGERLSCTGHKSFPRNKPGHRMIAVFCSEQAESLGVIITLEKIGPRTKLTILPDED